MSSHYKFIEGLKATLLLIIVGLCLFGYALRQHGKNSAVLSIVEVLFTRSDTQWMFCSYLAIWCTCFIALTFGLKDIPLVGLLLIAAVMYSTNYGFSFRSGNAVVFLGGITLGKGARVIFEKREIDIQYYLIGLVVLLAFSSFWHLDPTGSYHGPRWMGLWDNPNIYGILMGSGLTLTIGLLVADFFGEMPDTARGSHALPFILLIAAGMMGVGLLMSYSRGAGLGMAVGLLYLSITHGKFKWQLVLPGILFVTAVVCFFWSSTPDTSPWYVKRMDFGRPSAQHRVAAWHAAVQMMRDHPLGLGWNKATETYEKNYSPPEDGAAALTTNSYLILGTELGLPALLCFIAYIYLKFKSKAANSLQIACRAGALVLLVAFWFDGGLLELPTATLFWILLELGTSDVTPNKRGMLSTTP